MNKRTDQNVRGDYSTNPRRNTVIQLIWNLYNALVTLTLFSNRKTRDNFYSFYKWLFSDLLALKGIRKVVNVSVIIQPIFLIFGEKMLTFRLSCFFVSNLPLNFNTLEFIVSCFAIRSCGKRNQWLASRDTSSSNSPTGNEQWKCTDWRRWLH